ncbi:LOW QUALITY PROTEIN: copine-5b [Megalobrama amblycephala]|uniref:LOW QUALITY PROTEIN: copine-5b n=1 Tax=Megalobrama amblycephala TaxID=75352 RepID=UPI0020142F56|nr:LOW QUALITY PROTEIN: copine-5b [Megalobrama amblycephala]
MEGDIMDKLEDMASVYEFDPLTGNIPATKVEITVSCRNLLDRDTFSKSDPLCVLYTQGVETKQWREFGRTEVIDNTLNPDFVRKYILDYFFEEKQSLRFDLYDVDSKSPDLSKHKPLELYDFLGQMFCTLGEIVGSPASRLEKPLGGIPGKNCGIIVLSAEELGNCRDSATMQFCANKLDKKDFFGKSDPFMVFFRSNEDGTFTICHKTEVVKNTLNPVWQPFTIPVRALCNGDYDRTIKVEVYDWDRDGSHDFIGEFTTSYRELARGQSQFNVYEVVNPKKKMKKKKYVNSGTVTLLSFSVESESTFLDYIKGGTQINFTVAIDFTASNGNPSQSTSLHYMNPYQMNAYALALKAVGEIIQDYDSDKMFPALGFGAKLPPDGRVSHEFPLNGNIENPYCNGIEGILEAYHQSLKTVQLYGPTNFAPVVNLPNILHSCKSLLVVARYAAAVQDGSQYFVLLIITDGVISDMSQTKEAIVNAAKLPMSIIIVGVGQAEFDAMVELDGDDIRISSRGKLAERDIVQFVPFRDYMDRTGNHVLSMARLAKDVLAEIPDQFISYMKSRGIKPNPSPPPYTPPGHTHHTQI